MYSHISNPAFEKAEAVINKRYATILPEHVELFVFQRRLVYAKCFFLKSGYNKSMSL